MPIFTVVGYYLDNHQLYASDFHADDSDEAIEKARGEITGSLRVCGVFVGPCQVADELDETMDIYPREEGEE